MLSFVSPAEEKTISSNLVANASALVGAEGGVGNNERVIDICAEAESVRTRGKVGEFDV